MSKANSHSVIIKVRFDKPVTRGQALRELRQNVHGTFYTDHVDCPAGLFKVKGFGSPAGWRK